MLEFLKNEVVSSPFKSIRRIGEVPLDESFEMTHLCTMKVLRNQGEVRGLAVRAIVANRHVEKSSRNVTGHLRGWLE